VAHAALRLRQEDCEFDDSLSFLARPCLKKQREREGEREKDFWIMKSEDSF
jgi:hypothetical protein